MPVHDSPVEALDFTKDNWPLFAEGAQKHLEGVKVGGVRGRGGGDGERG